MKGHHCLVLLLLLLLCFSSCNKDKIDYENSRTSYFQNISQNACPDSTLTCVTFNIHLGFRSYQDPWDPEQTGADAEQVQNITRMLKSMDPDVIALQEVPLNRHNAVIKNFLEALAHEMNMNYAFGSHGYNDPSGIYPVYGEWGTAILTRYKILSINNVQVEYTSKWEKRSLLDAVIECDPATNVHVISLHYLPIEKGIPNTAAYVEQLSGPVIVLGDFNYTGEIPGFTGLNLKDVDSTYELRWIDRIFYSGDDYRCVDYGTIPDSLVWVSDHPANYGVLKVR